MSAFAVKQTCPFVFEMSPFEPNGFAALRSTKIPQIFGELCKNRVIGNDEILHDIAVWNNQTINANCLKGPLRTGASGNPPHKHRFAVCSVLHWLRAEVGNKVEQIQDALG